MKKLALILVMLLVMESFSFGQIDSIKIKDVNVNDNAIQVLIENNLNQDFVKELFVINGNNETLQEVELKAFEAKFFVVNYKTGTKLETLQVIVNDNTANYKFTGQEDTFFINQETSQAISTTESNSPISYIYSAGRVAKIQDGNVIYYSSDNIGSTSLETDNLGNVNFKANYLPFGKELSFSSINNEKYGFTGKEYDYESSLNYFNARYYNPSNGKFISNDPIFKPTEGGYQYVNNNPLTITDPSGMQDVESYDKPTFDEDKKPRVRVVRNYGMNNKESLRDMGFNSAEPDDGENSLPLDIASSDYTIVPINMDVEKLYGERVAAQGGFKNPKGRNAKKQIHDKFFAEGNLAEIPIEYRSVGLKLPLADADLLENFIIFAEEVLKPEGYTMKIVSGLRTKREQRKIRNRFKASPGKSLHNLGGRAIDVEIFDENGNKINIRASKKHLTPKAREVISLIDGNIYGLVRPYKRIPKEGNHFELAEKD